MSLENMSEDTVKDMAQVYSDLVNNPQTREIILRATKKVNPTLQIPEIDLKDQGNNAVLKGRERIESLENKLQQYEIKETVQNRRNGLKKDYNFNDDDIESVEKLMVEYKIPEHKTAAEFFKMQRESAQPTPSAQHTPVSLPQDSMNAMMKGGQPGLNQWSRGEAMKTLDDIMKNRR